ncbi:MAG: hypothetical protein ACRDTU_02140 [Micromonosporaceae bacterium]
MNTPDEREFWFRGDQPSGYQAPEQRSAGGTVSSHPDPSSQQDPLTGPMPQIESNVRASLAEAQEEAARAERERLEEERVRMEERVRLEEERVRADVAGRYPAPAESDGFHPDLPQPVTYHRDVSQQPALSRDQDMSHQAVTYQGTPHQPTPHQQTPHQHLERVPRYHGPAADREESASGSTALGGSPASGFEAAVTSFGRMPDAPQGTAGQGSGDSPSSGGPAGGYEPNTNALPTVAAPVSAQPADAMTSEPHLEHWPSGPRSRETPLGAEYPPGPVASGSAPPPAGESAPVPPAGGSPPRYDTEPGIPPSLVPMLSAQGESGYARHTEPLQRGVPGGQPPMVPPMPAQQRGSARGRSTNPAVLAAVVLATLLAVVPSILLLYDAVLGTERVSASGAVGGTLMLVGLPLLAAGLGPFIGANPDSAPHGARDLLRTPWVYLLVGVTLLLAAGLAVGQ